MIFFHTFPMIRDLSIDFYFSLLVQHFRETLEKNQSTHCPETIFWQNTSCKYMSFIKFLPKYVFPGEEKYHNNEERIY